MILLMLIILTSYAVRCDETSYYVIEMPENDIPVQAKKTFKVYWNVPTMQCKSKRIPFDNLYQKYGILQNENDSFRGEQISILYDPGLFPALLKNETSGKFKFRNGGVPQQGNLSEHLSTFREILDQSIPDKDFKGIGIIDFESWRPVFRQNFGILVPYKDVSYELVHKEYWWWPKAWIQAEAKERFEQAARQFMQTTLSKAKQQRPRALWGYYGFPYCFNMAAHNMREGCSDKVPEENDQTNWLWLESTALYPSIYSSHDLTSSELAALVRGRVKESTRVRKYNAPILPYFWYRYRDGGFLTEKDLQVALKTLYQSEASGFIIWGSSSDVNTVSKCTKLLNYLETILGPAIAKFIKPSVRLEDDIDNIENTTQNNSNITTTHNPLLDIDRNKTEEDLDPEFHWVPPENYTRDIQQYVEEELLRKSSNNITLSENKTHTQFNDTGLVKLLIDLLFNHTGIEEEGKESVDNKLHTTTDDVTTDESQTDVTEIVLDLSKNDKKITMPTEATDVSTEYVNVIYGRDTITEMTTVNKNDHSEVFNNYDYFEGNNRVLEISTLETSTEQNQQGTTEFEYSTLNYIDEFSSTTELSTHNDLPTDTPSSTNYVTADTEWSTNSDDVTETIDNSRNTTDNFIDNDSVEEFAESTLSLPSTATDQVIVYVL